jgi:iron complex outermembrane receptor protein
MGKREPFERGRLGRFQAGTLAFGVLAAIYNVPANAQLEEIVVSARRVEESLQDVPISVAAFTSNDLEVRGIERGEDLMVAVPNVVVGGSGLSTSSSSIVIRGMPNVGLYLDGVAQNSSGLLQSNLLELERVEVLRGPQGTLFGRNSNGGAIQLISKRPANEFGARVKAEFGEFNRQDLSAAIDVPISDTFLTKFTAGQYSQDGQICSLSVPNCYGGKDDTAFRADTLWTPSESFNLRVSYDYQRTRSSDRKAVVFTNPNHVRIAALNVAANGCATNAFSAQTTQLVCPWLFGVTEYSARTHEAGYPGGEVGEWQTRGDGPEDGIRTDFDQLTVTFNWDINDTIALESISAWWTKDQRAYRDIRGAQVTEGVEDDSYSKDKVWSQEFHLTGSFGEGRYTWLAGMWYQGAESWDALYRWPTPWARQPDGPDANCTPDIIPELQSYVRDPANWDLGWTTYVAGGTPGTAGSTLANWTAQGIPPSACFADPTRDKGTDQAIFGELDISLTDRLNMTLGVRWSDRDETGYRYSRAGVPGTAIKPAYPGPIVGDVWAAVVTEVDPDPDTSVWFTPKVSLDYQWTDDLMVYASYSEGFTAADVEFNTTANQFVETDPEVVKTVEFGIHSDWMNGRLRFNGSLFFTDWENIRTSVNPPDPNNPGQVLLSPLTITGGNAEASGFEGEITWQVNDAFRFNAAVGLLDTKYIELIPGVPVDEGQRFPYAPDLTYNFGGQYEWGLDNGGTLTLRADYRFMDDYVMHERNTAQLLQEGFALSSARLTYEHSSQDWSAYVYGNNLGDKRYWNSGFIGGNGGLFLAQIGAPQEFGAGFTFNFD